MTPDMLDLFSNLLRGGWKTSEGQMHLLALMGSLALQFLPGNDWVHLGVPAVLNIAAYLYGKNRTGLKSLGLDALKAALAAVGGATPVVPPMTTQTSATISVNK